MNILDAILGAQGGDTTQQLGRQFGLNESQVSSALSALSSIRRWTSATCRPTSGSRPQARGTRSPLPGARREYSPWSPLRGAPLLEMSTRNRSSRVSRDSSIPASSFL